MMRGFKPQGRALQLVIKYQMISSKNRSNSIPIEQITLGICLYICLYLHVTVTNEKIDHAFEKDKVKVYGKFWREKIEEMM